MKMLKVLEPKALLTAMLPRPCFATMSDAKRFGREVPAWCRAVQLSALSRGAARRGWRGRGCSAGGPPHRSEGEPRDILRHVEDAAALRRCGSGSAGSGHGRPPGWLVLFIGGPSRRRSS
jgi:hypothetical protein